MVSESDRVVDADGGLVGVSDDHQGLGTEMIEGIPASLIDQRSGQSLAAGARMSPDILVAGERGLPGENAQLGYQLIVQERAEPRPMTGFGETAPCTVPGLDECTASGNTVRSVAQGLPSLADCPQSPSPASGRNTAARLGCGGSHSAEAVSTVYA